MTKKKVFYPYPRRKWENDIVNNEYNLFEFTPKAEINHDEQALTKYGEIKQKLKKYSFLINLNKMKNNIRLIKNAYVPKLKINNIEQYDGIITMQLFLKNNQFAKKPYIIYIENSHSILGWDYKNYENPKKSKRIKKEILRCINDEYFKGFIFFSNRSKEGFYKYFSEIIDNDYKFLDVIYPYVRDNQLINKNIVLEKSKNIYNNPIELLYISSMFSLKGGCEIIEAFKQLNIKYSIRLNIVTRLDSIPQKYKTIIENSKNINVMENKLNNDELQKLFFNSHILLHPTLMDSTAIVVMEALKSGLPVIATDTFAIPEYIEQGVNGYLIENPIKYYDLDFKIQEPKGFFGSINTASYIDAYKSNTLYDYFIDELYKYCEKIIRNYEDFALNAYNRSCESSFSEKIICKKWEKIINNNLFVD